MGACIILTPVVIAAWPAFSAAVTAAATSLGYAVAATATSLGYAAIEKTTESARQNMPSSVRLDVPNSELVTNQLGRDQRISVTRDGVTATFARDARGKAQVRVIGSGRDEATLRALGEELSRRVVQKYVYQHLIDELKQREFTVVEEDVEANQTIRLKIRHWEN